MASFLALPFLVQVSISIGRWHLALKEVFHFSLPLRATFLSLLLLASFLGESEMRVVADYGPAVLYMLY